MQQNSVQKKTPPKRKKQNGFNVPKITLLSAFIAEIWERLWPLLVWAFICICVYAIFSWIGVWRNLDEVYRFSLLAIFILATVFSLYPLIKFLMPSRHNILTRIEKSSNLKDNPLTSQNDDLALVDTVAGSTTNDTFTKTLWAEHKKRMAGRLENLSSGMPKPNANRFDKYAIRAIVPLIAFLAWGFSFSPDGGSLRDGFIRHIDTEKVLSRLDVWITSPAYTGTAPLYISNKKPSEQSTNLKSLSGSILNLRYMGNEDVSVQYKTDEETEGKITLLPKVSDKNADIELGKFEVTHLLKKSGELQFLVNDTIISNWNIEVETDQAPTISYVKNPKPAASGSLELAYSVADDFGVISAKGIVRSLEKQAPNARPLVEAPTFELPLPRRRSKSGTSKVNRDLTSHPWAGSNVEITLEASDDLQQKGLTYPFKMRLPSRDFKDGLALALIEQRRILGLDANKSNYVASLLDAVTQFPEEFKISPKPYLAMRTTYRMIKDAKTDERLRDAMDLLWETALQLEYGDLTEAERKLREAQEKLSQALKNNASDEEIKELMDELRTAMNNFIEEMQRQMADNPNTKNPFDNIDASKMLTKKDLNKLMDRIENLARSGSKDAARELLSEMQRMMDNLKSNQQQQNQNANNELNQALDKFSEMLKKQENLMDQSFAMQNKLQELQDQQNNPAQKDTKQKNEVTAKEFSQAMKNLQKEQQALQKQLGKLGDELGKLGLDPSKEFGEAKTEMGQAGKQLGEGAAGKAADAQGKALQALRNSAQKMMQQMAEGEGGQGGSQRQGSNGQFGQGNDPLGRSKPENGRSAQDDSTKIPNEIDARRARQIMEAIRKRLSDPLRPSLERNYLERLLKSQ